MAAAPSSLGTQIREELSCSICLELFTRPKVLPCQHTFCQDCLQDHAGRRGTFQCPICRRQVRLPLLRVAGLPDNLMAASMCERFQVIVQSLPSAPITVAPAAKGTHQHHGNQRQVVQSLSSASIPAAPVARGTGHHHGNQRQEEHQPQKVTFGGEGLGAGQFNGPWGVTVSDEGEIFVVGRENQRIQVFTLQGKFVREFPTVVSGEEDMGPHDAALDREGNLWVVGGTDSADFAVHYNKQGRVLREFDLQRTGRARGVAVDTRRNHILITQTTGDWPNLHGEVLVFRPDGTLERTVGQQQGMKHPWYLTVDGEGNILVSDEVNQYVYVYNEDGQFLFQFGGEGSGEGQLKYPLGICTDRAGNIIVAVGGNSRVEMFDKTGKFLKHITADLKWPLAVAMTTHGQLVVTDRVEHKVSIFQNFWI
ncbi:hypothetical protein Bbelb_210860 [Branchiostoma belcheri]|nr:hypothetical protein Bbelb_210860 [Branchiostoma belcheri]